MGGPAPVGTFTAAEAGQALQDAGGNWLSAARNLAGTDEPRPVQEAASQAARLLPAFRTAMGNRPRTVAQVTADLERTKLSEGAFDPRDPDALARFVLDRGGIAPSPTGDLTGEYEVIPARFKSPRGLSP